MALFDTAHRFQRIDRLERAALAKRECPSQPRVRRITASSSAYEFSHHGSKCGTGPQATPAGRLQAVRLASQYPRGFQADVLQMFFGAQ
jgi:hypothetical protein